MKIHFGHRLRNTTPSTELPRDICPGIDPLQLDVVPVFPHNAQIVYYSHRFSWETNTLKQAQRRAAAGRSRHKSHGVIQY